MVTKNLNKNVLMYATSIALVMIGLSVAYHFLYYIPTRDQKAELLKQQKEIESNEDKNTQLRKQAIKECDEMFSTMIEVISNRNIAYQEKAKEGIAFVDDWNKTIEERCIQNKIDKWKGQ